MVAKTLVRYGIIFLVFIVQILFLTTILRENTHSYLLLIFIATLAILTLYTYLRSPIHHTEYSYESLKVAAWVPVGAVASYYLHHSLQMGPVMGAALVGSIGSFLPDINSNSTYLKKLPAAIYCGAFVGMSSAHVANGFTFVLVAGFFTAVFLIVSKSVLHGVGGKLGTLAFLGVALTYLLVFLLG
ncbi:hypothetical protein Pedsa_1493 [Pseudopedobacter saltans DSM 12145]|uniref:Uncharacterized protein n=1 Tax=Pseudopedobacter saltans (strain ATCC 51119 / DSM 12145 / JCM 21818 / CCUG 39354 / LMG 10337 / NBRC 100064 / NCIMB 13643) TaxID=762903 RepID=F0S5A9_PSESL|nr:hypothetical protein [Pseudopedobacter saltans]ADY52054.1 hypothetical protein Pedsa_1493 [Pseudopedobacter saltans DSM 12145]